MKKIFSLLVLGTIVSITNAYSKFKFSGIVSDSLEIEHIYLQKYIGTKLYPFDTISIKKNKFKKNFESLEQGLYAIKVGEQLEEIVLTGEDLKIYIPNNIENMPIVRIMYLS